MLTSSVVTEIARVSPDWTRPQILDIINSVTKLLLKTPSDDTVYIDPTTGDLPYLTTTAGTLSYTPVVSGVDFWSIRNVVVDADTNPLSSSDKTVYDTSRRTIKLFDKSYDCIPIKITNAFGSTSPSFVFLQDPGTSDSIYRIYGYVSTPEIVGEGVNIPIDDRFRHTVLVPACLAMIDAMDNGRYEENVAYIETVLRPKIQYARDSIVDNVYSTGYTY